MGFYFKVHPGWQILLVGVPGILLIVFYIKKFRYNNEPVFLKNGHKFFLLLAEIDSQGLHRASDDRLYIHSTGPFLDMVHMYKCNSPYYFQSCIASVP